MGNAGYGNHTQDPDDERPGKTGGTPAPEKPRSPQGHPDDTPSAGPHAEPSLTNPDATPGAGTLTPPGEHDDMDSTSS